LYHILPEKGSGGMGEMIAARKKMAAAARRPP